MQAAKERAPDVSTKEKIRFLFEEHYAMVYRAAYRVTGRAEEAEDVLQTVFLRLLQLEREGDLPDNPRAYLHRSAVNGSLDLLRKRKRWNMYALDGREELTGEEEGCALERREFHDRLRRALLGLSPLESKVFIMKYLEDCSNKEIAQILDSTVNNINVALHSARNKLKKKLSDSIERTS